MSAVNAPWQPTFNVFEEFDHSVLYEFIRFWHCHPEFISFATSSFHSSNAAKRTCIAIRIIIVVQHIFDKNLLKFFHQRLSKNSESKCFGVSKFNSFVLILWIFSEFSKIVGIDVPMCLPNTRVFFVLGNNCKIGYISRFLPFLWDFLNCSNS